MTLIFCFCFQRLRSENRLLRHRIENLEKENVQLADRLIQGKLFFPGVILHTFFLIFAHIWWFGVFWVGGEDFS